MIAVAAHTESDTRAQVSAVLSRAGWTVYETDDADEAVDLCRTWEADVLLIGSGIAGVRAEELIDRIKRDAELFRTAVVVLGDDLDPQEVLEWIQQGADDVLRTPPEPADVLGRAFAAARTKALVKELTARNDRLEELVFFDELTGLRNRRAILHELGVLMAGSRRQRQPLAVLMLDVDCFKQINDQHGHRAGDEVLCEVSRRLRARLRDADLAGRLGGDEVLIVLPGTGSSGGRIVAESIRGAIADGPMHTTSGSIEVTVSIGTATLCEGDDPSRLLDRADRALYAAKAGGRDQAAQA